MSPTAPTIIVRPILRRVRAFLRINYNGARNFSTTPSFAAKNRIYNSVRTPDELQTLLLLSASGRTPLITLWTASWCPSCQYIKPLVKDMIEKDGVGEDDGGVGFTEVELDSVLIGDLGVRYMINSLPTLLSFSRSEPQLETKVTRLEQMKDRKFLREWIETEARRGGAGGAGGSLLGGWFGKS